MDILEKTRKAEIDFEEYFDRRIKVFPNGEIEIRNYKKSIKTSNKYGYTPNITKEVKKRKKKFEEKEFDKFTGIREDSLSRTRKKIVDYAKMHSNEWKCFITLTFADNISDLNEANKEFHKFVTKMTRANPNFKYLGVPEFQKRGAVHYHFLTNLEVGSQFLPLQEGKSNMYNCKYWNCGFSSVIDFKNTDNNFNPVAYICKYLSKDLENRLYGRKKILKSNNLQLPNEYRQNKNDLDYADTLVSIILQTNGNFKIKNIECNKPYSTSFALIEAKIDKNKVNTLYKDLEHNKVYTHKKI